MGDQLYLERFVWFDNAARRGRFPNATRPGDHFEITSKTAQRFIDHFRLHLSASRNTHIRRRTPCTADLPQASKVALY
ncbi:MAG: hypothetical protein M0T70_13170 [Geobacteraceae bacterium]|nr:hypothetical protein [Geobacteraceae bacterium]